MRKKWTIAVAVILALALAIGLITNAMATQQEGEVGISLRIVGEQTPTPTPTPTPTTELGFTVNPTFFALGDADPGDVFERLVTVTNTSGDAYVRIYCDVPSVPWGSIVVDYTPTNVVDSKSLKITIFVNESATPGNYTESMLFHR